MKKRYVILYWLLLLFPTIIISTALFQLLNKEQEKIVQAAYSTAQDRARTIAETIQLTTKGVTDTVEQALLLLPVDRIEEQLRGFATTTDLVSHVFIWSPEGRLLYPGKDTVSPEERRFMDRYGDLFSGRIDWPSASEKTRDLSRGQGERLRPIPNRGQKAASPFVEFGGWIPWLRDNRMSILGWALRRSDQLVYGIELNMKTILSWMSFYIPGVAPEGMEFALVDGSGRILHQTGAKRIPPDAEPYVSISLSPSLPHWNVAMYVVDAPLVRRSGKSFVILAGLLLAIFAVSIILGGTLLTWQAHRNMMSAQQKTSFVSNVSHELKTPLTSIRMFAELLKENRVKDPAKKSHYLQVIVAESQRLTRLVNNVLDFSRLEQGSKKYNVKEIDIAGFLQRIVETQRLRIQGAGMELHNEIGEKACIIRTDEDAIEQVLLNLMDNAIKYASDGKELVIDLDVREDPLRLRVMDRGPGIPSRHRSRIFEKFHRVDDSLTSRQPGSGLGLSIARSIMRELKGDLQYDARVGRGSCFIVLIPVSLET